MDCTSRPPPPPAAAQPFPVAPKPPPSLPPLLPPRRGCCAVPHWRHSLRDGKFLQSQLGQLQSSYRARSTPIDWSCSRILSAVSAHASTHTSADYDAGLLAAEGQLPLYYIPKGSKVMQRALRSRRLLSHHSPCFYELPRAHRSAPAHRRCRRHGFRADYHSHHHRLVHWKKAWGHHSRGTAVRRPRFVFCHSLGSPSL